MINIHNVNVFRFEGSHYFFPLRAINPNPRSPESLLKKNPPKGGVFDYVRSKHDRTGEGDWWLAEASILCSYAKAYAQASVPEGITGRIDSHRTDSSRRWVFTMISTCWIATRVPQLHARVKSINILCYGTRIGSCRQCGRYTCSPLRQTEEI